MMFLNFISNVLLTVLIVIIPVTLQSEVGNTNPPLTECHWNPFKTKTESKCTELCSKSFGFWDNISEKLICYHEHGKARPIQWTSSCVCGYAFDNRNYPSLPCIPKMQFDIAENQRTSSSLKSLCAGICHKIEQYTYLVGKKREMAFCGDSNKVVSHRLQHIPNYYNNLDRRCQCALLSSRLLNDANSSKERGNERYTEKMCEMGQFIRNNKRGCHKSCTTAKGFISENSVELVCYHHKWNAQVISSEKCQCGVKIENKFRNLTLPCVPEVIYTSMSADSDECEAICGGTTAFLFGSHRTPDTRVTRCELPLDHKPDETFDELKTKILPCTRVPTACDTMKRALPCECGVGSLLPQDFTKRRYPTTYDLDDPGAHQMNISKPEQIPGMIADFSKSPLKKRAKNVPPVNPYDHRQKRKKNYEGRKSIPDFLDINRNKSWPANRSEEEEADIPTPPPIAPDLESFLEIMDDYNEWEEPVGNYISPSINTSIFPIAELPPSAPNDPVIPTNQIISPLDINQPSADFHHEGGGLESITNPYFIGSSFSQTLSNDSQQMGIHYPTISAANMSRFQNVESNVPTIYDLFDLVSQAIQIIPQPDTSLHPSHHDEGSLESMTNPYFKRDSTSQVPYNRDFRQRDSHFSDISTFAAADFSKFQSVGLSPSSNVPANSDLYDADVVFQANQIIPQFDTSQHPSYHDEGSLESMTNPYFQCDTTTQVPSSQDLQPRL